MQFIQKLECLKIFRRDKTNEDSARLIGKVNIPLNESFVFRQLLESSGKLRSVSQKPLFELGNF